MIYTIRTIFKKKVENLTVEKYHFKYIKCLDDEEGNKKREKEKEKEAKENKGIKEKTSLDNNDSTQVKDLNNINKSFKQTNEKYIKAFKYMEKDDRNRDKFNQQAFLEKLYQDFNNFNEFINCFREDTKEPFTKQYDCILGENFLNQFIDKFEVAINTIKIAPKSKLEDYIRSTYKECFHGTDGKVLLEILLILRKDSSKDYLENPVEKKKISDIYDGRI